MNVYIYLSIYTSANITLYSNIGLYFALTLTLIFKMHYRIFLTAGHDLPLENV